MDALWANAPDITPYRFGFNTPVWAHDPDGNFEIKGSTNGDTKKERKQNREEKKALRGIVREARKEMKSWSEEDWDFVTCNTGMTKKQYENMFKSGRGPVLKFTDISKRSSGLMNGDNEGNKTSTDHYAHSNDNEIVLDEAFFQLYKSVKDSYKKGFGVGKLAHQGKKFAPTSGYDEKSYIKKETEDYLKFATIVLGHEAQHSGAAKSGLPSSLDAPDNGTFERGEAYEIYFYGSVKQNDDFGYGVYRSFEERKYLPGQYNRDAVHKERIDKFWNMQYGH